MTFGEKLLKARKDRGLSQEELAARLGVSRQAVSKWETEESRPDLDKLAALCTELGLSMDFLCLDRQAAEQALVPEGRSQKWPALAAALLIFALGMLAGRALFPVRQVEYQIEYRTPELTVEDIELVDVQIWTDWSAELNQKVWNLSVMPGTPADGLQVRFLIENSYGVKNTELQGTADGAFYTAVHPVLNGGSQSFTAELELNGQKQRIPLMRAEDIWENGYTQVWQWEK